MHQPGLPIKLIAISCVLAACAATPNADRTADVGASAAHDQMPGTLPTNKDLTEHHAK